MYDRFTPIYISWQPTPAPTYDVIVNSTEKPECRCPLKYSDISSPRYYNFELTKEDLSYYHSFYGSYIKDYDANKYNNNNICNLPHIIFVNFHKTHGYQKYWFGYFRKECNLYTEHDVDSDVTMYYTLNETVPIKYNMTVSMANNLSISKLIMYHDSYPQYLERLMIKTKQSTKDDNKDIIIILSERKPLETILSGYNYHAMGNEKDWTNIIPQPGMAYDCFKDIFNNKENVILINKNSTMYMEYAKGYIDNYSNITALRYGLYLEFIRYYNCAWRRHIKMYKWLKDNRDTLKYVITRFQWFHHYNYTKSIYYLLNILGINKDIYMNKTNLLSGLLSGDLSNDKLLLTKYNDHVTNNKYNKTLQIDLILNYSKHNVCKYIKNMTINLDYKWKYNQYC